VTDFVPWPKTRRLFRNIVVTEKLDGTNAAIHVDADCVAVAAQSRNRLITPEDDNYGFARWVADNAETLGAALGPGVHFGEWWGRGIQRNYGLTERRFSLFNTAAHAGLFAELGGVAVAPVPVLYVGTFSDAEIAGALDRLKTFGSVAAPGYPSPEGVCVFHTQSRTVYKVTLDANDAGKWEAGA
jgi:hypothetical protein